MKSLLMASGFAKRHVGTIVLDLPMDTSVTDQSGNTDVNLIGYASLGEGIVQVDGRGALRVQKSKGLRYVVKNNGRPLFSRPEWSFEFEVRYASVGAFRHDPIIATRPASNLSSYKMYIWNREQFSNRLIMNTAARPSETSPLFAEPTTVSNNRWYRYRFERNQNNQMSMYRDGIFVSSLTVSDDFTSEVFDIIASSGVNFFDGWIRNIKVSDKL